MTLEMDEIVIFDRERGQNDWRGQRIQYKGYSNFTNLNTGDSGYITSESWDEWLTKINGKSASFFRKE